MQVNKVFLNHFILVFGLIFGLTKTSFTQINADSILHIAATSPENINKADAFIDLAFHYADRAPEKTKLYAISAFKISKKLNYPTGIGCGYFGLGLYYDVIDKEDKAANYYFKSLSVFEALKDTVNISIVNNTLGVLFKKQGNCEKALEYYFNAAAIDYSLKDSVSLAFNYNNIGNVYVDLEESDNAIYYYNKALELHKMTKTESIAGALRINLGIQYEIRGSLDEAELLYKKSLDEALIGGNRKDEMIALVNLGYLYTEKQDFEKASVYFKNADEIRTELGSLRWGLTIFEGLQKLEEKKGNYQSALYWSNKVNVFNDSISSGNIDLVLGQLQTEAELAQKEKQIREFEQKKGRVNKAYLTIFFIFIMVLILGIILFFYQKSGQSKRLKNAEGLNEKLAVKQVKIENELIDRNKELTTFALHLVKKNEFLNQIEKKLRKIPVTSDKERFQLNEVALELGQCKSMGNEMAYFQQRLKEQSGKFYKKIEEKYPNLTRNEKKLAALLRLGLATKEIAVLNHVGEPAVKMSRHRLRKHLNLSPSTDLKQFFQNLEN